MAVHLIYVDCDVPEGMTLAEWRRAKDDARTLAKRNAKQTFLRRLIGGRS